MGAGHGDPFNRTACLARSLSPLRATTHSRANRDFPGLCTLARIGGVLGARFVSAEDHLILRRRSGAFVSARKIPFPGNGDCSSQRFSSNASYFPGRPRIWCCLDHSAGKSARRAKPIPCGSRPSIAALMRSGARNASEIVMLTLRTLHASRFAILSAVAVTSVASSSSQRRPRAIDATNVARVSDRIGRAFCRKIPSGRRISRRRIAGALHQAIWRELSADALRLASSCWARWMTN